MLKNIIHSWLGAKPGTAAPDSPRSETEQDIDAADVLIQQGQALEDQNLFDEAERLYRQAIDEAPRYARAHLNMGNLMDARGNEEEAEACYRLALRHDPDHGGAYANLGKICLGKQEYEEALELYTRAAQLIPGGAGVEALIGKGLALTGLNKSFDAISAFRQAVSFSPEHSVANLELGRLLMLERKVSEAKGFLETGLSVLPDHPQGHSWLGKVYSNLGMAKEASEQMNLACRLDPDDAYMAGMRLFTLNYDPEYSADVIFEEQKAFAKRFLVPHYPAASSYQNSREPERRLKIGYVSFDFKHHPVSVFAETLFTHHDRSAFEIHAWYTRDYSDHITERFERLSDIWHPVADQGDSAIAQAIQNAGIDILVDLNGLTEGHRLGVFARKPAPIQATWLGYLGTTALETMDYRICDQFTDPPELTEQYHTETLARLPDCQWCHAPYDDLPPVGGSPITANGFLTLGSFNNAAKLNDQVLALWADILAALPTARLKLAAIPTGAGQSRIRNIMEQRGIKPDRLEFIPRMPYQDYLETISTVDIALDPFPYNGGTTSIDILMMGVPFITLAGDHSFARGGVSLLSNIGLQEFIADSQTDFLKIVQSLSEDPGKLARIRSALRDQVEYSPLLNGSAFTRNMEKLYRDWWKTWCDLE